MSELSPEARQRLYELLPAVYRLRDEELIGPETPAPPLRVLLGVIEEQFERLEGDVRGLYADWFIETCAPWVVPYIGDLLRVRRLHPTTAAAANFRAYVANTLDYRSRKGTVSVLESLSRDVSGWPTRAVEGFRRLAMTQAVNHVTLARPATLGLRRANELELLGGAFERAQRTPDLRRIERGRGRHNLPNVTLFVFRLRAFPLERAAPRGPGAGSSSSSSSGGFSIYHFDALGRDLPLFAGGVSVDPAPLAPELGYPVPLRRRALHAALGVEPLPFSIRIDGTELPAEAIGVCDLEHNAPSAAHGHEKTAWVDPAVGRFALRDGIAPEAVSVDYAYGFAAELGGGPYDRSRRWTEVSESRPRVLVSGGGAALSTAIAAFVASAGTEQIIEIQDSQRYSLTAFELPPGKALHVRAGNRVRPVLDAEGQAVVRLGAGAALELSGVLVACSALGLEVSGRARALLRDATLALPAVDGDSQPAEVSALATDTPSPTESATLELRVERSIVGPLRLAPEAGAQVLETSLAVDDCIVQGAITAYSLVARASTVFGEVTVTSLEASNALFAERVHAARIQEGCVRFCYVPPASRTPRRHRCQPDLALAAAAPPERELVLARVVPLFTSRRFGDPEYAELDRRCVGELARGADDESELGAFHHLFRPQCHANLTAALEEYLRSGLEAGVIDSTQGRQR